jgi:hypothetical protein
MTSVRRWVAVLTRMNSSTNPNHSPNKGYKAAIHAVKSEQLTDT